MFSLSPDTNQDPSRIGALKVAVVEGAIAGALVSVVFCLWLCIGAHLSVPHSRLLDTSVAACEAVYNVSVTPAPDALLPRDP